jgi:hypothetical protein
LTLVGGLSDNRLRRAEERLVHKSVRAIELDLNRGACGQNDITARSDPHRIASDQEGGADDRSGWSR